MNVSVALWDGRIDARDDLCRALGLPTSTSDVDLVALAFDRWGDDAPARIVGDFALAVWDEGRRRLVLARDRFGVRPLREGQPEKSSAVPLSAVWPGVECGSKCRAQYPGTGRPVMRPGCPRSGRISDGSPVERRRRLSRDKLSPLGGSR